MQKIIGIPQNRERVFIVSIRNDIAQNSFCFPEKIPLTLKLKDLLEEKVEEKYYLTEKALGRIIKKNNRLIREMNNPEVSTCIVAGYPRLGGRDEQCISEKRVQKIAGLYDTEKSKHQAGSVYNSNGVSPTLTTMDKGGNKQPYVLVREATKKGYTKAMAGDAINISYPNSTTKRGRVGREISKTILASSAGMAVLESANKPISLSDGKQSIQDRIYDIDGIATSITASKFRPNIMEKKMFNPYNNKQINDIAPTQTTSCNSNNSSATVLVTEDGEHYLKIRKLTPLECWRLMGFDDKDFYKAKFAGISDSQLYKQAGNSIVVNVLEGILSELLCVKEMQKCA